MVFQQNSLGVLSVEMRSPLPGAVMPVSPAAARQLPPLSPESASGAHHHHYHHYYYNHHHHHLSPPSLPGLLSKSSSSVRTRLRLQSSASSCVLIIINHHNHHYHHHLCVDGLQHAGPVPQLADVGHDLPPGTLGHTLQPRGSIRASN